MDRQTHGIPYVINRYVQTLETLRQAGGPINPKKVDK
jgi:hypothetical protein